MRPQQQNRRIRGRGNNGNNGGNNNNNNNNRRGPNPLTRTYESNGPDVKIRGTAQQVADKYATLARDAQSSGDRVMAENYLQHAEHYNRIIAAAQAQLQAQQPVRDYRDERDDEDELDLDNSGFAPQNNQQQPQQPVRTADDGSGPQPVIEGVPAEVALNERQRTEAGEQPRQRPERRPRERLNGRAHERAAEKPAVDAEQTAAEEAPAPALVAPVVREDAAPEPVAAEQTEAQGEEKPVKRTRRPRVRKAAEASETQPEETAS
ncbi:hypothetical protein GCM10011385_15480 [Nitratireductor aestuarii]|uniref:DUF4167 domain-containing protein n=1 Tax=Nitratireductor aestuarii TaxID=1735103 RepID=A0A916W3D0_9HYPH|nr:DUF4167 domain-containing protein [Nitratireductor aestuarii]GGA62583.1 hypothetical protein GCM10011385_15480 [Nitratireductor aestuarii]